jgi:hypothetical protein
VLVHGYSDATRSRNIAQLRRDGYPARQAAAIAYRIQREERMKHRRLARRNPSGFPWAWVGVGAAVGVGGIFAYTAFLPTTSTTTDKIKEAALGATVGAVGGAVAAAVFK